MFTLSIETDNDAFHTPGPPADEVARILRAVADRLDGITGDDHGKCRDANGHTVGEWQLELDWTTD